MKQHITPKQFQELPKEISCKVFDLNARDWRGYKDDFYGYHHKKITIGKMIETLMDKGYHYTIEYGKLYIWEMGDITTKKVFCPDIKLDTLLCDALWDAVKYILS